MWIDIAEWEKEKITEKIFSYQGQIQVVFPVKVRIL